jgi:hypothetical protein
MRWLMWRELVVITRSRAFWTATAAYVAVLTAYALIWGTGIPIAGGGTPWEQFASVQKGTLIVLLPWIAARFSCTSRQEITAVAVAMATKPATLLRARAASLCLALLAVELSATPIVIVMRQITAMSLVNTVGGLVPIAAVAVVAACVSTGTMLLFRNPLTGWLLATAITALAGRAGAFTETAAPVWIATVAGVAMLSVRLADAQLMYLPEQDGLTA